MVPGGIGDDEMAKRTKKVERVAGETFQVEGVAVMAVEVIARSIAYGFRPAMEQKIIQYSAQRPNGSWEGTCPTPAEAVRAMRMIQEMKEKQKQAA